MHVFLAKFNMWVQLFLQVAPPHQFEADDMVIEQDVNMAKSQSKVHPEPAKTATVNAETNGDMKSNKSVHSVQDGQDMKETANQDTIADLGL